MRFQFGYIDPSYGANIPKYDSISDVVTGKRRLVQAK
jgi:hypothetical protein